MEFLEFETEDGKITVNMEHISYLQETDKTEQTILTLSDGEVFVVNDGYENVSGFLMWVADGRPDLDHCPDCGGELVEAEEVPEEAN
jgi:hypothetical protein